MFMQVIQGDVTDPEQMRQRLRQWRSELKPGAKGYIGSTVGVTPDGRSVALIRFESEEAARANSERPEQGDWWEGMKKAYSGEVTFHDCRVVDSIGGHDCDHAGFVQVIQARAKDQDAMRARVAELEPELRRRRPEILGMNFGWHGDGSFTEAVYFKSEAAAREGEASPEQQGAKEFLGLVDGQPTFFDLRNPELD